MTVKEAMAIDIGLIKEILLIIKPVLIRINY